MNGPIAQIAALTIYGNAVLTGHSIPKFFPDNSTCKFCDEIAFAELGKSLFGKVRESRIAASPDEWFSYLRKKWARGVRLLRKAQNEPRISDRISSGFVGGGVTWMIEVTADELIEWLNPLAVVQIKDYVKRVRPLSVRTARKQ